MTLIRTCSIILALLFLTSCSQNRPKELATTSNKTSSDATPSHATRKAKSSVQNEGSESGKPASLPSASKQVSNDLCYVCHLDFDGEDIVETHLAQNMGCTTCHGPSEAHMSDEEHLTAPDIILKRGDVNRVCGKCHKKRERCPQAKGTATRQTATSAYGEIVVEEKVCTDCHGDHKLEK